MGNEGVPCPEPAVEGGDYLLLLLPGVAGSETTWTPVTP